MSEVGKIYEAISNVMADVGPVGKNGKNDQQGFKFRKIDDVYNALQPVLAKHRVFFVPNVIEAHEEMGQTKSGTKQIRAILKVQYKIFTIDGSFIECVVQGEGLDTSDKATNKAITAAFKYMLIQIFCIAVEGMDDADKESPEMEFVPEKKKPAPRAIKNHAPKNVIKDGKYKGKQVSDIPAHEMQGYIEGVVEALEKNGKEMPEWFLDLQEQFYQKQQ